MNLLQIILIATISYSALFLGTLLAKIAKEEMTPGKPYFQKMQLLLAIAVPLSLLLQATTLAAITTIVYLTIWTILHKTKKETLNYQYALFGLALGIAAQNINTLAITASLIFLYGLPTGSMMKKKSRINYSTLGSLFLGVTLIIFYTTTLFPQ
jgi:hypothetical protein|tara:strand:+ start:35 stop:496 length:462 start_codon:yes stop_codon:yes gene_type:complete